MSRQRGRNRAQRRSLTSGTEGRERSCLPIAGFRSSAPEMQKGAAVRLGLRFRAEEPRAGPSKCPCAWFLEEAAVGRGGRQPSTALGTPQT